MHVFFMNLNIFKFFLLKLSNQNLLGFILYYNSWVNKKNLFFYIGRNNCRSRNTQSFIWSLNNKERSILKKIALPWFAVLLHVTHTNVFSLIFKIWIFDKILNPWLVVKIMMWNIQKQLSKNRLWYKRFPYTMILK